MIESICCLCCLRDNPIISKNEDEPWTMENCRCEMCRDDWFKRNVFEPWELEMLGIKRSFEDEP